MCHLKCIPLDEEIMCPKCEKPLLEAIESFDTISTSRASTFSQIPQIPEPHPMLTEDESEDEFEE